MKIIATFLLVFAIATHQIPAFNQAIPQDKDVLFSIPAGDEGVHYVAGESGESVTWGRRVGDRIAGWRFYSRHLAF
jgi:hypothetical protein